jgi:ABC-2 type transport system permease protein
MKDLVILARREFWEHRSLWIAPLAAAGVLLLLATLGSFAAQDRFAPGMRFRGPDWGTAPAVIGLIGLSSQIFLVSTIAAVAYLLDSLYAERKDRSILFWKSLPVSDARTVLVKYGVAMLIVPLGVYALAAITFLILHAILSLALPQVVATGSPGVGVLFQALGRVLASVLVTVLWYAPLGAWLMLASVFARRSPWLIVSLIPVGLFLLEGMLFQTRHVLEFIGWRLRPVMDPLDALQRPALWLGLVAAAGMLYIVIRLRRYRDDT